MPPDYQPAPPPADETARLAALRRAEILDTPPEAAFDRLARLASELTGAPIALVSLVDDRRQWFKAKVGLAADETPRDWAFCAHALLRPREVMVVPDAADDPRFRGNPLVTGDPNIRFYAGAPIVTVDGQPLGTVCAIDRRPRPDFGPRETAILRELAAVAADEIELRQLARQLDAEMRQRAAAEQARARAEAEAVRQRAAQALMNLTGGIAHEFNNLFTGMILMAENMTAKAADETQRKMLNLLLDTCHRGSRLTNAMQAYAGRQYLEPGQIDLPSVLQHAATMIPVLHGKRTTVDLAVTEDCRTLDVDGRQLLAAIAELAANAVEAAAPEPAQIRISTETVTLAPEDAARLDGEDGWGARPGRFARIALADRGPGMDEESRRRACEPFFTTKPVGRGPGLGLSMAQGFARQSGGFLTIDTAPGAGTTVALYLPAV